MKGRATANFEVHAYVSEEVLHIDVTSPITHGDKADGTLDVDSANGTVALGKLVAQLAKVATPISSRERKVHDMTSQLVSEGLSEARALTLAESFVK